MVLCVECVVGGGGNVAHSRELPMQEEASHVGEEGVGTWQLKFVAKVHVRERVVASSRVAMNATLGKEQECEFKDGWRMWSFCFQGVHCREGDDSVWRLWLW